MNLNLSKKNALVGGSTAGIGKAIAKQLASQGATITLLARNEEKLQQTLKELPTPENQTHDYLVVDFTQPDVLKEKVTHALKHKNFHILINNTGGPKGGPLLNAAPEEFENAFRMHVICNQILVQLLTPGMKNDSYGRIINIISTSVKQPIDNLGVSNTIRGAVANWSKTLANEVGKFGITVNNILPGFTETGRLDDVVKNASKRLNISEEEAQENMKNSVPAKRFGLPEELASAAGFLASEAAAYINGVNLPIDGGRTKSL